MENGQHRLVSTALRLPSGPTGRPLRRAASIVDHVHADGELPVVRIELGDIVDAEAFIEFDPDTQLPRKIVVDRNANDAGWSLIHEIGHLLDYSAIGEPGAYGSPAHPLLVGWREAITASGAYQRLRSLIDRENNPRRLRALARLAAYSEFWARGYVQFVAIKSREPRLLKHLDWLRHRTVPWAYTHLQWGHADFVPIADEIDAVLRSLGWIR